MVNLELYRVFYAVVKCGSLTGAAEELSISQSAVSQSVKQLETQIGCRLFNRHRKGVELTEGGKLVLPDVERALALLDGAELKVDELNGSPKGTIRIGASETIFQYLLSEKIVEYNRLYPQVKIELISEISPKIIDLLKHDKCDIGFLNLPIAPDGDIKIVDTIAFLHDIFVAGKAFSALADEPIPLRSLVGYPLLIMEKNTVARNAFDSFAESNGVELCPSVEVNSWGYMKQLVSDGMGIGCVPREYVLHRLSNGTLIELNVWPSMPVRSVAMATAKRHTPTFATRAFTSLFAK